MTPAARQAWRPLPPPYQPGLLEVEHRRLVHAAHAVDRHLLDEELGLDQGRRLGRPRLRAVLGLRLGDVRAGLDVGREHLSWGNRDHATDCRMATVSSAVSRSRTYLGSVLLVAAPLKPRRGRSKRDSSTTVPSMDDDAIRSLVTRLARPHPSGELRHRACRDRHQRGGLRSGPLLDRRPWRGTRGRGGDIDQARPPRIAPARQWRLRAPRGGALRASSGRARLSRGRLVAHRGRPGMGSAWATACATASSSAARRALAAPRSGSRRRRAGRATRAAPHTQGRRHRRRRGSVERAGGRRDRRAGSSRSSRLDRLGVHVATFPSSARRVTASGCSVGRMGEAYREVARHSAGDARRDLLREA